MKRQVRNIIKYGSGVTASLITAVLSIPWANASRVVPSPGGEMLLIPAVGIAVIWVIQQGYDQCDAELYRRERKEKEEKFERWLHEADLSDLR